MEEITPFAQRSLDERLAQVSLKKLDEIAADASVDSPPFYNCFINRFAPAATEDSPKTQG